MIQLVLITSVFAISESPRPGIDRIISNNETALKAAVPDINPVRPPLPKEILLLQKSANLSTLATSYTYADLNAMSYPDLIMTLSGLESANDIDGLWNFSNDANTFWSDSNRVIAIIDSVTSKAALYTSADHLGLPVLCELLRAGFYHGFYNTEVNYLNNSNSFIKRLIPAQQTFINNTNFGWGTEIQEEAIRALASIIHPGVTNVTVVNAITPILSVFIDSCDSWKTDYYKKYTFYWITAGVDYAVYAVEYFLAKRDGKTASDLDYYGNIDAYWTELAQMASYGTYDNDIGWLIDNSVWYLARIGIFLTDEMVVIQKLSDIIDQYGRWNSPALWAAQGLDTYYEGRLPDGGTLDMEIVKEQIRDEYLPLRYRFDDNSIIFKTGDEITLEKAKKMYWAIKEVRAQFLRMTGVDEPIENGHPDDSLIAIIYNSPDDYEMNNFLYGLSTNNGGIYIESWGTFFTYERTTAQSSYTLEDLFRHEYVHYLQTRYLEEGYWGGDWHTGNRLTWWEEGGAECIAGSSRKQGIFPRKVKAAYIDSDPLERMQLSSLIGASYNSGSDIYTYGWAFYTFLYQERMDLIFQMNKELLETDYSGFDDLAASMKADMSLSSNYEAAVQKYYDESDSYLDAAVSDDYLALIPDGDTTTIKNDIQFVTGMTDLSLSVASSEHFNSFTLRGVFTGTAALNEEAAFYQMDSLADLFLDQLDDLSWFGYKTLTCYFVNYRIDNGNFQYDLVFTGYLDDATAPEAPVPITLISFTAKAKKGMAELSWETASETNNASFVIYRNDVEIASVEGAGTTSEPHNYEFTDSSVIPGESYTYVLADISYANDEVKHTEKAITIIIPELDIPQEFALEANYPNPFNPQTAISYQLSTNSQVELTIYDMYGRKVADLINEHKSAGYHSITWDASGLSSGIYFYRLTAGEFVETKKMVFMK